jgi:hypothetical protein
MPPVPVPLVDPPAPLAPPTEFEVDPPAVLVLVPPPEPPLVLELLPASDASAPAPPSLPVVEVEVCELASRETSPLSWVSTKLGPAKAVVLRNRDRATRRIASV